jgi:predicted AAA+ superfamily ATPase
MIPRSIRNEIDSALVDRTAVVLSGLPRVGRSELAKQCAANANGLAVSFDASVDEDRRGCIERPDIFIEVVAGHLVVIENIDASALEPVAAVVRRAAEGNSQTRFLLLARHQHVAMTLSHELIGMVKKLELAPIQPYEARQVEGARLEQAIPVLVAEDVAPVEHNNWDQDEHWLRGGLPNSLRAGNDTASFQWRVDYIRSLIDGGFGAWGIGAEDRVSDVVGRIVRGHRQTFVEQNWQNDLRLDRPSLRRTIAMLTELGLVRRVANIAGPHPVVYVRDSGLFHAMRGVQRREQLRTDELHGFSWEGFATEALIMASEELAVPHVYRNGDGDEIDLILDFRPAYEEAFAIEFKVSSQRNPEPGFRRACAGVRPTRKLVVHSGTDSRNCGDEIDAVPLLRAIELVQAVFAANNN